MLKLDQGPFIDNFSPWIMEADPFKNNAINTSAKICYKSTISECNLIKQKQTYLEKWWTRLGLPPHCWQLLQLGSTSNRVEVCLRKCSATSRNNSHRRWLTVSNLHRRCSSVSKLIILLPASKSGMSSYATTPWTTISCANGPTCIWVTAWQIFLPAPAWTKKNVKA